MSASLEEQVHTSIQTSLHNLRHSQKLDAINDTSVCLDSLILHSPFPITRFEDTITLRRTVSSFVPHKVRALGVANISHDHLARLYEAVDAKPSYVQNRFHPETNWEISQRQFCKEKGIVFQAHKALQQKEEILASDLISEASTTLRLSR